MRVSTMRLPVLYKHWMDFMDACVGMTKETLCVVKEHKL